MMYSEDGEFTMECDACDNTIDTGYAASGDAVNAAKAEGWSCTTDAEGDDLHLCPDCASAV